MANYFDDIDTATAGVMTAYNALCAELADDPDLLEQLRYAIYTDLLGLAAGIESMDFCKVIRNFGGISVAGVKATADEGAGDYTP